MNWNWGKILTWAVVVLYFGATIGYAIVGDWRRTAYFFFAGCLTITLAV